MSTIKGAIFEDAANGFQYPLPELAISIQRSQMSPQIKEFSAKRGFNEYGVSISAMSASANDKIQKSGSSHI